MPGTVEEIKVLISADARQLPRELSAAEKAVLKAKGIVQSASGGISGSSKAWAAYRTAAVSEMNKALEGVRKAQEKISALRSEMQATTFSDVEVESTIQTMLRAGDSDETIQRVVDSLQTPAPELQQQYAAAQAELQSYSEAAKEAGSSVEWLNQKVAESKAAEQSQTEAAKSAAQQAKEQASAAREAARAHTSSAKAANSSGGGLARFGKTALFAMFGAATLYAGLRRLISAFMEAAKADSILSTSLGQIKGNLSIAFQTVYQAALPALRALASMLATATSYLASFLSMLFGISWSSASQGAQNYAKSIGAAGGAAKAAAQNMMAIDELNVMNSESGGGGGGGGISAIFGEDPQTPAWLTAIVEWLTPIKDAFEGLWVAIKDFFDGVKERITASPTDAFLALRDAITDVINAVSELLKNEAFQALVAGIINVAIILVASALSVVAEGISLIVSLLNGDGVGATQHFLTGLLKLGGGVYAFFIGIYHGIIVLFKSLAIILDSIFAAIFDAVGLDSWADSLRESVKKLEQEIEGEGAALELDLAINDATVDNAIDQINEKLGVTQDTTAAATEDVQTYKDAVAAAQQTAAETQQSVEESMAATTDALTNALAETPTADAAKQLGAELMDGFGAGISENSAVVTDALDGVMSSIAMVDTAKQLGVDLVTAIETGISENSAIVTDALSGVFTGVSAADTAKQLGADFTTEFGAGISENTAAITEALRQGIADSNSSVVTEVSNLANDSKTAANEVLDSFLEGVGTAISDLLERIHFDMDTMLDGVLHDTEQVVTLVNDALSRIHTALTITVTVKYTTEGETESTITGGSKSDGGSGSGQGNLIVIPELAASGGVFSSGQLIYAREAGPEIIGSFGAGRTGIMNNDQIVDSVSNGVYQAMVDAMGSMQGGDKGDFVVNVDGRELLRVTRSAERSSGYQLSGNPTFTR